MGIKYVCDLCRGNIPVERQIIGRRIGEWQVEFSVYKHGSVCMTGHLCEACQFNIYENGEDIYPPDKVGLDFEVAANYLPDKPKAAKKG